MDIGYKIKKIREIRNYTQEYMAEKLGISQVSYCRIETNQTLLSLNRFQSIAEILEIDPAILFNFDESDLFKNCNLCSKNLVQKIQLTEQDEKTILEIIRIMRMLKV